MTTDLDRLELELRCIPGVVAVGLDRDNDGRSLLVQTVVMASEATPDLRNRIRRVVDSNVREPVSLEIVVDTVETGERPPPETPLIDWTARNIERRATPSTPPTPPDEEPK